MSKKKGRGDKDVAHIALVTAVLALVTQLVTLITKLVEWLIDR